MFWHSYMTYLNVFTWISFQTFFLPYVSFKPTVLSIDLKVKTIQERYVLIFLLWGSTIQPNSYFSQQQLLSSPVMTHTLGPEGLYLVVSIGKDLSCCCGKYLFICILSPKSKKIRKYHYTFWQIQLQQVLKKQEFFFKCCLAKQDKMKEWCHFLLHQLHTIVKTNHYQR